jgi:exodeoxyribonuclease-3
MRIISVNVNGIRAAARKGFFAWLEQQDADVVCIQETKAQEHQLEDEIFCPAGFHCYYHDARKKGYSGVAIYSRQQPDKVHSGLGWEDVDSEGRYLQVDLGGLSVVSLYMPSGSSKEERQAFKYDLMERLMPVLQKYRRQRREYIICGDWNIAHKKIDIKNWRGNQKNSGFLPEERAWMDQLFGPVGYVDAFRVVNDQEAQYTWWSNRGQAWANNVGWRIDYQVITPALQDKVLAASIYKDQRFSDHAPLIIDYAL